ncbi:hypothetical protein D3C80_901060 [compost metagenome]
MLGKFCQSAEELFFQPCDVADQIPLLDDLQVFETNRGRDGMTGGSEAMAEHADTVAFVGDRLIEMVVHDDRRKRHVGRRDLLRHDEHVRLDAERLAGEHLAGSAETADDFVGDEKDVVFLQDGLNTGPVAIRRHQNAAGAHHRLAPEGGDRFRAFLEDQVLQILQHALGEIGFAFAFEAEMHIGRAGCMNHPVERQVEALMVARQAGDRA